MDIENNGYPIFWKHVKDKKTKIGDKKFDENKINNKLICPMNYLMQMTFKDSRSGQSTLPMSYFFNKFELEESRRQSKKVEEMITKYSIDLFNSTKSDDEEYLLLRDDFDNLIDDIKNTYISKTYIGLMSWLIDRAFLISADLRRNKKIINRRTNENKSILLKVLYDINSNNLLKIFSKNS